MLEALWEPQRDGLGTLNFNKLSALCTGEKAVGACVHVVGLCSK